MDVYKICRMFAVMLECSSSNSFKASEQRGFSPSTFHVERSAIPIQVLKIIECIPSVRGKGNGGLIVFFQTY